jgi:23S rRNA (pseudouridine1915-N3)-methyltransferase
VAHYRKLLTRYARLEEVELREDSRGIEAGEQVARRLPPRTFVVLLAAEGRQLDSLAFSRLLEQRRQSGMELAFVIGGPFGLELPSADLRLSLGAITLPHQLARVVLLEQLYRAHRILAGEPYHH